MTRRTRQLAAGARRELSQPLAFSSPGIVVDEAEGVIRNLSIISEGEAIGHGFAIDRTTLDQVLRILQSKPRGVKSRLTHPKDAGDKRAPGHDAIEVLLGKVVNPRIEGTQVRGDMAFGLYASKTPLGDLRGYLMAIAKEDPANIGLSIVFEEDEFEQRGVGPDGQLLLPAMRVKDVIAADFVGDPGANPNGLLSQGSGAGPQPKGAKVMKYNIVQLAYLKQCGLKDGATAEEADKFVSEMPAEQSAILNELAEDEAPDPSQAAPATPGLCDPAKNPQMSAVKTTEQLAAEKAATELAAKTAEKNRVKELTGIKADSQNLIDETELAEMIQLDVTPDEARKKLQKKLKESRTPVSLGRNLSQDSMMDSFGDAILMRAGLSLPKLDERGQIRLDASRRPVQRDPAPRAQQFRNLTFIEMGRIWLQSMQLPGVDMMSRMEIAQCMLSAKAFADKFGYRALAQGTGDFSNVLADSMRKSLRLAYLDAPKTWEIWARRAFNPDFKQIRRVALSAAPSLVLRAEGQGVTYGTLKDTGETYYLSEYSGGIILTRHAIINDDLDAFQRVPQLEANAAGRKEDDVCYATLLANAQMADGVALFDSATHKNFTTADSPTYPWIMAADSSVVDTVEVCFLSDEPAPVLQNETQFDTGDVKFAVRHTVAAKAIDHRGMYQNNAAAPSVTAFSAGRKFMRRQKDPAKAAYLNYTPKFIIAAAEYEDLIDQLLTSPTRPEAQWFSKNTWANKLVPVIEPRLDAAIDDAA